MTSFGFGFGYEPRTRVGGFSPEAQALFARFTTPPTDARKVLINNLIGSLITAGVWSKLDAMYVFAAADSQAAKLNWVADQYNCTEVNAPAFQADRGFTAASVGTKHLNSNFNPTTAVAPKFQRNDCHLGGWSLTVRGAGNFALLGAYNASPAASTGAYILNYGSSNLMYGRLHDAGTGVATNSSEGCFIASRLAAETRSSYKNGVSLGDLAVPSTTDPKNLSMFIGCANNNGAAGSFAADQIAFACIGGGLTGPQVEAFEEAVREYLVAVGAV